MWLHGLFPDVFSAEFRKGVARIAERLCAPRVTDSELLGYYTDNELDWNGWRRRTALLDYFFTLPVDSAGRSAAEELLRQRHGSHQAAARAWDVPAGRWGGPSVGAGIEPGPAADLRAVSDDRDAFLALAAETYFSVTTEAIRAVDPNHMTLGVRFAGHAEPIVLQACGRYNDVISFNNYSYEPPAATLEAIFAATLRPIMITEWSFKAMDSGLPNTKGAAIPVHTQEDRAAGYERSVTQALSLPYVVGLHWFKFSDQPPLGRVLDGENSNYGIVTEFDEPYVTLAERMRQVNARAYQIARSAPPLPGLERPSGWLPEV
jgi:agarase